MTGPTPSRTTPTIPPALTRQLISCIGNKRRLLPLLARVITENQRPADSSSPSVFLDPMCGSGAVSRLARHLGFAVHANDWEEFAWVVTASYLENSTDTVETLFEAHGGVHAVFTELNRHGWEHPVDSDERGYIARNYAPAFTANPRLGEERLFYTAENARFIDRVRDRIDRDFPVGTSAATDRSRRLLIAALLVEAATHANTSGVFKAYHRGFGGHGKDALSRILAPMRLEEPNLVSGPEGTASCEDAFSFVSGRPADVCYLDPPYNSHQYGSNYFMLNTIARWDRPPVNNDRDDRGNLLAKAGIRSDWVETRSPFCSRASAGAALSRLLGAIDARVIVVSYSPAGFITPEEMADRLAARGAVVLHGADYTSYRGGRQSPTKTTTGQELIFVVRSAREAGPVPSLIPRQLAEWRVRALLRERFVPDRLRYEFAVEPGAVALADRLVVRTDDCHQLAADAELADVSTADLDTVASGLERARCVDHAEEFHTLLSLIIEQPAAYATRTRQRRLVSCLRKLAHRKHRKVFGSSVTRLRAVLEERPGEFDLIASGLERITTQARARFGFGLPADDEP